MSSIKNPNGEAQNPAPMPKEQQGQGGAPVDRDPEGRQGGTHHRAQIGKPRMAPRAHAPPGLEQEGHGDTIPVAERTADDQQKARGQKPEG